MVLLPPPMARRPSYLRLSVTDRCNLRCAYCRPCEGTADPPSGPCASNSELIELVGKIDRACPVNKLRLTGGEPLLRADLVDLVRGLRRLLPDALLALTTNGSLLERLAAPLHVAGIVRVNVSLDTLDRVAFATLTRGGRLDATRRGVEAAQSAGLARLKLNTVLIRRVNGDRLGALVRWATQHACEIRFIELMPCGPGAALFATGHLSADDALTQLKSEFEYLGEYGREGTSQRHAFSVDGRPVTIGMIAPVSHPFCGDCNRLRLDARGRLISCLRRQDGENLLELLRRGAHEFVAERIEACLVAKTAPGDIWPDRQMVLVGG